MINNEGHFRPWGRIQDILRSQSDEQWALIGCASFESRCTSVFTEMHALRISGPQLIFEVDDPLSISTPEIERLTAQNLAYIEGLGFQDQLIVNVGLTDAFKEIERALKQFLGSIGHRNLIVDITSLPKKVYFFVTKLLFQDPEGPRNVVFTYAEPERYSEEPLAANPDPWEALPGFRISPSDEIARSVVVGIGYEPLGLPDLVDSGKFDETQMTFLFPFPAQADRVARNWQFIRGIFPNADSNRLSIKRVDGINVPEVFQALSSLGEGGELALTLAPFGPKPVSLAMALYAARHSSQNAQTGVYYTQPTYYNPNYSSGVRQIDGQPVVNAYCVKSAGQFLY